MTPESEAAAALLRRIPLFEELDDTELQAVAESMHERQFAAGETVSSEGSPPEGFYVVESGSADVSAAGQPRGTLGPGDYFGEIALMMGSDRTATITAVSELRCHGLNALDFRNVVEANPTIAWKLAESMIERLS